MDFEDLVMLGQTRFTSEVDKLNDHQLAHAVLQHAVTLAGVGRRKNRLLRQAVPFLLVGAVATVLAFLLP